MGRFFSDRVETALKYIYCDLRTGRGQQGFRLLQQAVQDGDADACCLLARCLYGPAYTWPGHGFPVDDRAGDELMRRSVLGGQRHGDAAVPAQRGDGPAAGPGHAPEPPGGL